MRPSSRRNERTWGFSRRDIKVLDADDAPMIATFSVTGDIDDDFGGGERFAWATKHTNRAVLKVIRRHCRELIHCARNKKDPTHDYANDDVKPKMPRSAFLLKATRVNVHAFGRSITTYELKSLRAAPVEYVGRCAMFLPSEHHLEGGLWVDRNLKIDREGELTLTTIPLDPSRQPDWLCLYCKTSNSATRMLCSKPSCGGKQRLKESLTERSERTSAGAGCSVGDQEKLQLDPKLLCAVQTSEWSHGRPHCVLVTLNKLPNGTVLNAAAHHRFGQTTTRGEGEGTLGGGGGGGKGGSDEGGGIGDAQRQQKRALANKEAAATLRTLTFSCVDELSLRKLLAAFKNSTSAVLPSVRRAAQRLDMATLQLLVDGYGVNPNSFNSYGNTAVILAIRATMSAFQLGGGSTSTKHASPSSLSSREFEKGVEVVDYLLCKGADPYLKDHSGRNAFDYLFEATKPRHPVRRRLLQLLNLCRVRWDHDSQAAFLLSPVPDPTKQGNRALVLRPGQADKAVADAEARKEREWAVRRERKGLANDDEADSDEDAEDGEGSEGGSSSSSSSSGGGCGGGCGGGGACDSPGPDHGLLLPSNACVSCGGTKLFLVREDARWVCPTCGYLEDWTDAPLDTKVGGRSAGRGGGKGNKEKGNKGKPDKEKLSPEEMIYERRMKQGDSTSAVAWASVDKTNLYLTLPREQVDDAKARLRAPDPHRLTGFRRTQVFAAKTKNTGGNDDGAEGGAGDEDGSARMGGSAVSSHRWMAQASAEEEFSSGGRQSLRAGTARTRARAGGAKRAVSEAATTVTLVAMVGDGGKQRVVGENDSQQAGGGEGGSLDGLLQDAESYYTDKPSWDENREGFTKWETGGFGGMKTSKLPHVSPQALLLNNTATTTQNQTKNQATKNQATTQRPGSRPGTGQASLPMQSARFAQHVQTANAASAKRSAAGTTSSGEGGAKSYLQQMQEEALREEERHALMTASAAAVASHSATDSKQIVITSCEALDEKGRRVAASPTAQVDSGLSAVTSHVVTWNTGTSDPLLQELNGTAHIPTGPKKGVAAMFYRDKHMASVMLASPNAVHADWATPANQFKPSVVASFLKPPPQQPTSPLAVDPSLPRRAGEKKVFGSNSTDPAAAKNKYSRQDTATVKLPHSPSKGNHSPNRRPGTAQSDASDASCASFDRPATAGAPHRLPSPLARAGKLPLQNYASQNQQQHYQQHEFQNQFQHQEDSGSSSAGSTFRSPHNSPTQQKQQPASQSTTHDVLVLGGEGGSSSSLSSSLSSPKNSSSSSSTSQLLLTSPVRVSFLKGHNGSTGRSTQRSIPDSDRRLSPARRQGQTRGDLITPTTPTRGGSTHLSPPPAIDTKLPSFFEASSSAAASPWHPNRPAPLHHPSSPYKAPLAPLSPPGKKSAAAAAAAAAVATNTSGKRASPPSSKPLRGAPSMLSRGPTTPARLPHPTVLAEHNTHLQQASWEAAPRAAGEGSGGVGCGVSSSSSSSSSSSAASSSGTWAEMMASSNPYMASPADMHGGGGGGEANQHEFFSVSGGHRQGYSYLRGGAQERPSHVAAAAAPRSSGLQGDQPQRRVRMTAATASKAAARAAAMESEVPRFDRHVTQSIYKRDIARV